MTEQPEHGGGGFPLVIVHDDFNEKIVLSPHSRISGRGVLELAHVEPLEDFVALLRPEEGGLRELELDEEVDLASDRELRVYVVRSDRLYRFEIDDVDYLWPKSPIEGRALYSLAGLDEGRTELFQLLRDGGERSIAAGDEVDLAAEGVERFQAKPRQPKSKTIFINDVPHAVGQQSLSGAQIKALGKIESDYQLFLEQPGDDIPIANEKSVEIKDGERFYSLPPATFGQ